MNAWPDTFHEGDRDSSPGTRPPKFTINVFRSISDKMPVRSRLVSSVQLATLMRKTHQVPRKDEAALLTLVTYRPGATSRGTADIESARCVYGDIDKNFDAAAFDAGIAELEQAGVQVIAYQTYRHTPEAPRWRVLVLLDEPVQPEEYRACWQGLQVIFCGMLDGAAKDISRLNYWPSCPPGETREVRTVNIEVPQ